MEDKYIIYFAKEHMFVKEPQEDLVFRGCYRFEEAMKFTSPDEAKTTLYNYYIKYNIKYNGFTSAYEKYLSRFDVQFININEFIIKYIIE